LVPLTIAPERLDQDRGSLPELPVARQQRFVSQYGLPEYDAGVLTSSRHLADYFETCVKLFNQPKTVSNWVMGELLRELNHSDTPVEASPISPERFVSLLKVVDNGTISLKVARDLFPELYASGKSPEQLVQEKGLTQVSDEGALETIIDEVMAKSPAQLAQYRSGKDQVLGFFVGQVLKASGGKANPGKVNELLKRKLAG
jgi:aspartyl-tRNA(Asn)/glutamyl-tRNA(Gln) amidotransferase subunit B